MYFVFFFVFFFEKHRIASYISRFSPLKIELISCDPMNYISDIKLIRTDTTLDISQKAEKGIVFFLNDRYCTVSIFDKMHV